MAPETRLQDVGMLSNCGLADYVGSSHLFRVTPAAREAVSLLFGEQVLNHSSVLVDP